MKFEATPLADCFIIHLERYSDDRGFFSRLFCVDEFQQQGIDYQVNQCNISSCSQKGTLRGLHYQNYPALEAKLVRCARGKIFDAVVDMRPDSATYLQAFTVTLDQDSLIALYVPPMFAHGYQALADDSEAIYFVSGAHSPNHERGIRYDDPKVAIPWPDVATQISVKDTSWPLLSDT